MSIERMTRAVQWLWEMCQEQLRSSVAYFEYFLAGQMKLGGFHQ
jgi:hypothetical protein